MLRLQTNPQIPIPSQGQFFHYQCPQDATYSFTDVASTAHSLIPAQDLSPVDCIETPVYHSESSSPSSSLPPSPLYEAHTTLPPSPTKKPATRLRSGNRVPRPRNAFMIFRSEFWAEAKISKSVEHDHRHISRIIGHCWNQLTEEEKGVWRRRAEREKVEHGIKYPGYRFSPNVRTKQVIKRNVKRNGEDEMLRCKQVAELLLAGKAGKELDSAVKSIDNALGRDPPATAESKKALNPLSNQNEVPAFRSPLLPPAEPKTNVQAHQYSTTEIHTSNDYQEQQHPSSTFEQNWTLQFPIMAESNQQQTSYVQQYIPEPQQMTVPSQGYHNNNDMYYASSSGHHGAHSITPTNHAYPRSSAFPIDFNNPFGYHGRDNECHGTQGHINQTSVDPLIWIPSRHGH